MKQILYLGTDPSHYSCTGHLIHYPIIKIIPKPLKEVASAFAQFNAFTHVILTSKNAAQIFCAHLKTLNLICTHHIIISIGKVTAAHLKPHYIAEVETQEGIIALLEDMLLQNAHIFLPRSSISRPCLAQYLTQKNIAYVVCDLYDTQVNRELPIPDLKNIDEIVFTSPSTVRAFIEIFGLIPQDKTVHVLGPVTRAELLSHQP